MRAAELLESRGEADEFDAQLVLAHALDRSRTHLLAHLDSQLSANEIETAERALSQLRAGVPVPYILGHWEFFGLDFRVTPDVLIPRPETELLVEHAIAWLQSGGRPARVADVGTGSGVIAIAIALRVASAHLLATDISRAALLVAQQNAERHGVTNRIEFVECDLLPPAAGPPLNLICANLPYIPSETLRGLDVHRHEPRLALDGGTDGLEVIRKLSSIARQHLDANGMMLCEIEASQAERAIAIARASFPTARVQVHKDLAHHDRMLEVRLA